jgi:hypothetical protein
LGLTLVILGGVAYVGMRLDPGLRPLALFLIAAGALAELWLVVMQFERSRLLSGTSRSSTSAAQGSTVARPRQRHPGVDLVHAGRVSRMSPSVPSMMAIV